MTNKLRDKRRSASMDKPKHEYRIDASCNECKLEFSFFLDFLKQSGDGLTLSGLQCPVCTNRLLDFDINKV